MNIALFASAFHPHIGGVEELVRQLARAYRARNHGCIVITNQWPLTLPAYEEFEGTPLYRFSMHTPEGPAHARLRRLLSLSRNHREIAETLSKHKIDLIHVQCVGPNGYYAQIAQEKTGLPLVVTTQGERTMDATQLYQRSAFMNATMRILLARADFVTACSRHTLDDIESFFAAPFGERARVVYNGIELSDFAGDIEYSIGRPYVLGIGRMVKQKGFDLLINAFADANLPEFDLVLAGEGPEYDALKALARERKIESRVHFPGRADRKTAVALFKNCAWFVLPSRMEPQGIVNLEAMAARKAVVAANVGGVPEIVLDEKTGLLFEGENVAQLAAQMTRLASDETLRNALAEAGNQRAQSFAWPQIAAQYLEIYASVLKAAPKTAPKKRFRTDGL